MNSRLKKLIGCTLAVWLVGIFLTACQPVQPVVANVQAVNDVEKDAFVEVAMALEQAFQNEDLTRVVDFYANDAISYPPGFPHTAGKEGIATNYKGFFEVYEVARDFELTDVEVGPDFATRTGQWTQVLTPKDGGEPITEIGRCILGWKKVEGDWKVAWEIWNTYEVASQEG